LWKDRIDEDIRLMREAGINLVRVGEFAWSSMEPEEGRYDLGWLRKVLDKCHAAGIGVVLCTPTPTPPRWLTEKYPEVLRIDCDGQTFQHGSRQHVSHTSPRYRELSRRITGKLAEEFGRHPALVAWQTDNEFLCHVDGDFGPSAEAAWHEWLKDKYGTIENLNSLWRTFIWSEDYPSFESVPMARKTPFHNRPGTPTGQHHCSLAKDWGHFVSDTVVRFQSQQLRIIRRHSDAPVTHNHIAQDRVFAEDLFAELDFAATDIYVDHMSTWRAYRTLDWMRGVKMSPAGKTVPYMVLETSPSQNGSTQTGHASHPRGYLPAEAAIYLGMGGSALCYWLWRQQAGGAEMCHGSVVTAWGTPSVGWGDVRAVSDLIEKLSPLLTGLAPALAEVAVHESRHSRAHMYRCEKLWRDYNPWATPTDEVHRPLLEMGLWRDVRFETADVSRYKVVLSPFMPCLTDGLIDRMVRFVEAGGVWVVGPMSGCRTEFGTVHTDAGLGRLDGAAGVKTLWPVGIDACRGRLAGLDEELTLGWYCFGLEAAADDCDILGEYVDGPAAGAGWAAQRKIGKGRIVLLAAHAPGSYGKLLETVLGDVPLRRYRSCWGTTVIPREGGGRRGYIVANWDGQGGWAELPHGGTDLVSGQALPAGTLQVKPFGVCAVQCD
jgi:beta-galactosidase